MKRLAAVLIVLALFITGCAQTPTTGVEPGDGPAATDTTEEPLHGDPMEGEGDPMETPPAATEVASFSEKYTYEDGVEVEVTKIKRGKITRADTEYNSEVKAGDAWVQLTVRVRNGSSVAIDSYGSFTVTYGPDGEEAETVYADSIPTDSSLSGKILPGKAKTTSSTHSIPEKYQGDVVLEFTADLEHEPAIFSGSVK